MSQAAATVLPRIVQVEILDGLAADDPRAQRSRRDLVRVHKAMGTRTILRKALRGLLQFDRTDQPLRILELGAGDGSLLLRLARDLAPHWPRVELSLLDRQPLISAATIAGFAELGWSARAVVADALDWAKPDVAAEQVMESGSPVAPWHLIVANLFLHHFSGEDLACVLAAIAARSERVVACEPRRARLALVGSHLLGALGAGPVTREDAVLSVHAGFRGDELSTLWRTQCVSTDVGWRLDEYPAGLFSHCFVAERGPG